MIEDRLIHEEVARAVRAAAEKVAPRALKREHDAKDTEAAMRGIAKYLGEKETLRWVTTKAHGGAMSRVYSAALCLWRESLAYQSGLCDLAFAMQGLGSNPISENSETSGQAALDWLPKILSGDALAGFALTEPGAGTDLAGISTTAVREGDSYVLNGTKVYISNADIADVFTVFAATNPSESRRRLSAFVVPKKTLGLTTVATNVLGGHPIGEIHLKNVRVPASARVGEEGRGLGIALSTLHRFRPTVGAAALGFAQRALDEAVQHVKQRQQFGAPLAELQMVQGKIADMACRIDSARLLVYRSAAYADDPEMGRADVARTGSMAKLVATENAQLVVDDAVQLLGGRGVNLDGPVAGLYEEVRALRIYEGASDVQKLLIARGVLA